jgi:hypothetical protein
MTNDGMNFVMNLYRLVRQGGIGVGMNDPLPDTVRALVAEGYCEISEIGNPHDLTDVSRYFVRLTSSARELLDARSGEAGSDKAFNI